MESLIVLGVLLLLAVPVIAIIALVTSLSAGSRLTALERRIVALAANDRALQLLTTRVSALEGGADAAGPAPPHEESSPTAPAAPIAPPPSEVPAPAAAPLREAIATPAMPPRIAPHAPPSTRPRPARASTSSFEERFGTRWVVWIGGVALALGGIFLVRYSIQQGWIGPGVRIALGALLAALLIAAGEWLRRKERRGESPALGSGPAAHIPSILTAAGTTVAYATVFAAYALYDFVGPGSAFVVLGIVALATLAAALLHGPALAALGLVGAEVVPMLVRSPTPNYWALYIYLAVVTAAAFTLASTRLWRWLAITAVAFGLVWTMAGATGPADAALLPSLFHVIAGFALASLLVVAGLYFGPEVAPGRIDGMSSASLAAYLLAAAIIVVWQSHPSEALIVFAALTAAAVAIAWRSEAAVGALPAAALLAALVIISWAVPYDFAHLVAPPLGIRLAPEPSHTDIGRHVALGAFFALMFGAAGYLVQGRYERAAPSIIWAAAAVGAPLAILIALYYRIYGLERSLPFAGLALLLAAWCAVATEQLARRPPRAGLPSAAALHAAGSAAALALTLSFALEKGWLTVGLALMAPGVAWVAEKRPLPMLRWIAAAVAVLVLARIAWEPRIVGADVGTTPFFNWLLYGYGVPALAFWTAGYLLRRRRDDVPSRIMDAAAILFTVLFGFLEIRHAMNGGDIYASRGGLAETALHVAVGLAIAIGLERLRVRTRNVVHNAAALIVAALTLFGIVFGLFGFDLPLVTGKPVGGVFLNLLLLGYALPAVLAITLALMAKSTRPMPYRAVAAGVAVVLGLAYLTLQVMRLYHGPVLTDGPVGDAEQYTFSAVWLAYGVVLLGVGFLIKSKPARLAAAAVILLTVAKVFVIDLAGLAGIWRALSFIGLGLVLVGIGYVYQRSGIARDETEGQVPGDRIPA